MVRAGHTRGLVHFDIIPDVEDAFRLPIRALILANRVLQQLAADEEQRYPLASKVAMNDFYMDDVMTGY